MPTVRALLQDHRRPVASIDARGTVLEAARLMNEQHVGAVVVTRGEKVVGIFTERDVLTRVVAARRDPATTLVEQVMTAPVACCGMDTTRAECRAAMRAKKIRHLPVVENGRLMGMVSVRDILEDENAEQEETIRYLYEYMHGDWSATAREEAV